MALKQINIILFSGTLFFILCGTFLVPFSPHIISKMLVISCLAGIVNFCFGDKKCLGVSNKEIYLCVVIYVVVIMLSRFVHSDSSWIYRNLLYLMLFFYLIPRDKVVIYSIKAGSIIGGISIGVMALWQYHNGILRADGFSNAILFAQGALVLSIVNGFFCKKETRLSIKIIYFVSVMLSITAIYLSQSRGVWISLLFIFIVLLTLMARKHPLVSISLLFLGVLILIYSFNEGGVLRGRLEESLTELSMITNNNYNSSWGLRIMAWRSAWHGFIEHPILGIGLDGFKLLPQQQLKDGIVNDFYVSYNIEHAHNQFMQNMVIRGIPGLVGAIAIFIYPAILFIRLAGFASAGCMVVLGMLVCALSDVPMEQQNTSYMYVTVLFLLCFLYEGNSEEGDDI